MPEAFEPRGPASAWCTFWLSFFPRQARTVLWRYYRHTLPTRQHFRQLCLDRHLDPYCLLYGGVEDDERFLWPCTLKEDTWARIANRFLQSVVRLTCQSLALGSSSPIPVLSGLCVDGQTIIVCMAAVFIIPLLANLRARLLHYYTVYSHSTFSIVYLY
ncbi:hypothetical protein RMATCC62417_15165 [Rhizopus microsporus]|nr:hypothetical protein RMATCC62417_15165 [Rhizopus microsporus]